MSSNKEFFDQYKNPLWQKRRLEVLEYDKFTCRRCGDKESELHVHHSFYDSKRKVWEYSISNLLTVCDKCHKEIHKMTDDIRKQAIPIITDGYRRGDEKLELFYRLSAILAVGDDEVINIIKSIADMYERNNGEDEDE